MPAQSEPVPEAKLAWLIWQALEKLNGLLWDHYEKDFLSLVMQEEDPVEEDMPPGF